MRHFFAVLTVAVCIANGLTTNAGEKAAVDCYGDPLPEGAVARLGTVRLRQRGGVLGVAFSPDGTTLASTGWFGSIRLWDLRTGKLVRTYQGTERSGSFAVAFSPDGTKLASVGTSGLVRLWDVASGRELFKTKEHEGSTYGVAFAPDGLTFATAGSDGSVRLWDVASGEELLLLQTGEQRGDAHAVAFSPDGSLLASGMRSGTIRIWNLEAGGEPTVIENAHGGHIVSLAFTKDGRNLISSGTRGERRPKETGNGVVYTTVSEIRVWDVSTGKRLRELAADEDLLGDCTIALSKDGKTLASSHYGKLVVWEMPSGTPVRIIRGDEVRYGGRTHGLAISPHGTVLACQARDSKVYLWEIATGKPVLSQSESHKDSTIAVDYSPDGKWIATGSADATVRLWDAATGKHIRKLAQGTGWVRSVQFSADGRTVAVGAETYKTGDPTFRGEVKICRVASGEVLKHFETDSRVTCAALSADGKLLAAATGVGVTAQGLEENWECRIRVWELETGNTLTELAGHEWRVVQLAFSPDGNELMSAHEAGTVRRWSLANAEELEKLETFGRFSRAVLSPDMQTAYVSGTFRTEEDERLGKLAAWDLAGAKERWSVTTSDRRLWWLAIAPNGRILASFVRPRSRSVFETWFVLRDTEDGRELLRFELDGAAVRSLAFSRDGNALVSGMDRGTALVWDVTAAYDKLDR